MTARERALAVFRFERPGGVCFDLMENTVWGELGYFFRNNYGCKTLEDVFNLLGCDFRWSHIAEPDAPLAASEGEWRIEKAYSDSQWEFPLSGATSVAEVDKFFNPDPYARPIPDFKALRAAYPDKALVFCISWTPIFSGACQLFGIEETMAKMMLEPEIFKAFAIKQCEYLTEYTKLAIKAGAAEYCDFIWFGDDFAHEKTLLCSPEIWRKLVRPYLAPAIRLGRDSGLYVLFHSCGAVSEVYGDFIDMGINAHIGVQTSALNMSPEYLAKHFGGKIVVFGGVDAQTTLVEGPPDEVKRQVRRNLDAFAECGGYVVSNSHHSLPDIKGENIVAMAEAAGREINK